MRKIQYAGALAIAMTLTACGGGSDEEDNTPDLYAGAEEVHSVLSDGVVIHEETLTYLEISQKGQLSLQPLPATEGTRQYFPVNLRKPTLQISSNSQEHFPSLNTKQDSINQDEALAQASTAFQAFWQALQHHYQGQLSPEQLLEKLNDYDAEIQTLYVDYLESGLPLDTYIQLYEKIDDYFNNDLDEMLLRKFFNKVNITPAEFLKRLEIAGLTVDNFFQQMKERQLNISDLEAYFNEKLVFNQIVSRDKKIKFLSHGLDSFDDMWCMVESGSYNKHDNKCLNDFREFINSRWGGSYLNLEFHLPYVFQKIRSNALGKIESVYRKNFPLIPYYHHIDENVFDKYLNQAYGSEKTIKTNDIEFRGTFLTKTTYHIKMHLEAIVGAGFENINGPWIKKIKPIYTKKEKTKTGGWAVDEINYFEIVKPTDYRGMGHLVTTIGGIIIQAGIVGHEYLLFSNTHGDDTSGDHFKLTVVRP